MYLLLNFGSFCSIADRLIIQTRPILRLVFCTKCTIMPRNPRNAIPKRIEQQSGTKKYSKLCKKKWFH